MTPKDLEEYLNNIIKPALEEYAKEHNTTVENLLLEITNQNKNKPSKDKNTKSSHKSK